MDGSRLDRDSRRLTSILPGSIKIYYCLVHVLGVLFIKAVARRICSQVIRRIGRDHECEAKPTLLRGGRHRACVLQTGQ